MWFDSGPTQILLKQCCMQIAIYSPSYVLVIALIKFKRKNLTRYY